MRLAAMDRMDGERAPRNAEARAGQGSTFGQQPAAEATPNRELLMATTATGCTSALAAAQQRPPLFAPSRTERRPFARARSYVAGCAKARLPRADLPLTARFYLTRFSISLLRTSMSRGSGAPGHGSPSHCLLTGSGSLRKLNTETYTAYRSPVDASSTKSRLHREQRC